jgi:hypothetical protein
MNGGHVGAPGFPPLRGRVDGGPLDARSKGFSSANRYRSGTRPGIPRLVQRDSRHTGAFGKQWNQRRVMQLDHYRKSLAHFTKFTATARRPFLNRLSPVAGSVAIEWLTRVCFPLHRAVKRRPALQMLLSRVSPLLTCYHVHPQLDDRLQYEWAVLDTHDGLTDFYKHLRTEAQIAETLRRLGADATWVARGGNGVEARCRKPAGA